MAINPVSTVAIDLYYNCIHINTASAYVTTCTSIIALYGLNLQSVCMHTQRHLSFQYIKLFANTVHILFYLQVQGYTFK